MHRGIKAMIVLGTWAGCIALGLVAAMAADPKLDVEFAMASTIFVTAGAILGPVVGLLVTSIIEWVRDVE